MSVELIVIRQFDLHEVGDLIKDRAAVEAILTGENAVRVAITAPSRGFVAKPQESHE